MTKQDILNKFKQINVWHKGDQRAPHKPLLLLYALGRCSRHEGVEIPYLDVERDLKELLIAFGSPGVPRPEMPFWYLHNDELWFVKKAELLERRKGRTDPKRSALLKYNPVGGLLPEIYHYLTGHPQILTQIVEILLQGHFPASLHNDIKEAIGLSTDSETVANNKRTPMFRHNVLRAYGFRCAVCGYDLKLGHSDLGLEAAHIKWHQAGGPDQEDNGLALCVLHHKLFDRGAFSISDDGIILVSQEVHGSTGLHESLLAFQGQKIIAPQSENYAPLPQYLQWHRREVFRTPART